MCGIRSKAWSPSSVPDVYKRQLSMGVTMLGCLEKKEEAEGMLMKMVMDAMEDFISDSMEETQKDNKVLKKVNQVAEKARELSEELRRKVTVEELCIETCLLYTSRATGQMQQSRYSNTVSEASSMAMPSSAFPGTS